MIYITGDTHGEFKHRFNTENFPEQKEMSKDDYVLICGDFGGVWDVGWESKHEKYWLDWFEERSYTLLFIDGNHENFEQLNSYPVDEWNGGKVHFVESDIIHLMRGQVYDIDGTIFFTFGGAYSIDKMYRTEGISWFPEEMPTAEEYEEGWNNLENVDFSVDYILTHSAPREVAAAMGYGEMSDGEIALRQYLQRVADEADFEAWYFGHFHEDTEVEDVFFCLYDEMVEL